MYHKLLRAAAGGSGGSYVQTLAAMSPYRQWNLTQNSTGLSLAGTTSPILSSTSLFNGQQSYFFNHSSSTATGSWFTSVGPSTTDSWNEISIVAVAQPSTVPGYYNVGDPDFRRMVFGSFWDSLSQGMSLGFGSNDGGASVFLVAVNYGGSGGTPYDQVYEVNNSLYAVNTPIFIGVTWSKTTHNNRMRLYSKGILRAEITSVTRTKVYNDGGFHIGSDGRAAAIIAARQFGGNIAGVGLFNREVTAAEMLSLNNSL